MAIASAVVVPAAGAQEEGLRQRLSSIDEVEVQDSGVRGIAVVLESGDVGRLKAVSEEIAGWPEVVDFQLVYFNWEDVENG